MSAVYTSAEPASGCMSISKTGNIINEMLIINVRVVWSYMSLSFKNFAIANIVPIFANSAGCNPNFPKLNQAFAPPTSFPINRM